MSVDDYDTDPANNTTISGISVAEGAQAGGFNNAFRQLMADIKNLSNAIRTDAGAALQGLDPVADRVPYFTGDDTAALATLTSYGRALIAAADVSALINDGGLTPYLPPAGQIGMFAMGSAPSGWIACDGSTVLRTTYPRLFTAIGTTYGEGDGTTTFAVPDLRGEFLRGLDSGRGVDADRVLGSAQGDQSNRLIEMQTFMTSGEPYDTGAYDIPESGWSQRAQTHRGSESSGRESAIRLRNSGDENYPRNVALLACIKT